MVDPAHLERTSLPRLHHRGDLAIAAALSAGLAAAAVAGAGSMAAGLGGVGAALGLLSLRYRRSHPVPVMAVVFGSVALSELASPALNEVPAFLAILVAGYSVGAHAGRRGVIVGAVVGGVVVPIGHALGPPTSANQSTIAALAFLIPFLVLLPVAVGRLVRSHSQLAGQLAAAAGQLRSMRSQRVAATVAEHRAALGAQIEAVVLRGLDGLRAHGEARTLFDITSLERVARETLGEMRRLVASLRHGDGDDLAPSLPASDVRDHVAAALTAASARRPVEVRVPAMSRWLLRWSGRVATVALVVAVLYGIGMLAVTFGDPALRGPRVIDLLLGASVAAPIAVGWRLPVVAAVAVAVATALYCAVAAPPHPLSGALPSGLLVIVPFTVAAGCDRSGAIAGGLAALGGVAVSLALDPAAARVNSVDVQGTIAIVVGAWVAGRLLRSRVGLVRALTEASTDLRLELVRHQREALAEERARVARELHDAVGHALTVIVLQASAARRVWTSDLDGARRHASVLRETVRGTLVELHPLVASIVLADSETSLGVDRVEDLVERARGAGLDVDLVVTGSPRPLSPDVDLTAYRIVQEALTNAVRHAPGAAVVVRLGYTAEVVAIDVENDRSTLAHADVREGQGLRGMRERAAVCGGEIQAALRPDGGFAVRARLPLGAPA